MKAYRQRLKYAVRPAIELPAVRTDFLPLHRKYLPFFQRRPLGHKLQMRIYKKRDFLLGTISDFIGYAHRIFPLPQNQRAYHLHALYQIEKLRVILIGKAGLIEKALLAAAIGKTLAGNMYGFFSDTQGFF